MLPTLLLACAATPAPTPLSLPPPDPLQLIEAAPWADLVTSEVPLAPEQIAPAREALLARARSERRDDAARVAAFEDRALTWGDETMRFTAEVIGEPGPGGYPLFIALHGGGGAPAEVNDGQWEHMQVYWRDSVEAGIYVAPRGVTDNWNLHFDGASYPLYDRLIEDAVVFLGADPDRVYLLGFSAGGDGVYAVSARMPDRFAGACMAAGHNNGLRPDSLAALPFLVQMGEKDEAYGRHESAAEFGGWLDALAAEFPGAYTHDVWIHLDGLHNRPWKSHDPEPNLYPVLADPAAWLAGGDRSTTEVDSNAVRWLTPHAREARPALVVWDTSHLADTREAAGLRYWVDVGDAPEGRLVARRDREANAIEVEYTGDRLRLLVHEDDLDLAAPITVRVDGADHAVTARPTLGVLAETLRVRGDAALAFPAAIALERVDVGLAPRP